MAELGARDLGCGLTPCSTAQRKAIEIAEDVARQADPSIAPLFEKMRKAGEPRRPQGENTRGRKQPQ